MSDDPNTDEGQEPEAPEAPEAGHDDIMKRLVDYQRQLREGVEPTEAAATAWPQRSGAPGPVAGGEIRERENRTETLVPDEPAETAEAQDSVETPEETSQAEMPPPEGAEPPAPEQHVVDLSARETQIPSDVQVRPEDGDEQDSDVEPPDRIEILSTGRTEPASRGGWPGATTSGHEATRTEVSARIEQLQGTLDRLSRLLGDLRENFQNMAVAADDRLAAIEAEIERNRDRPGEPS